MGPLHRVNGLDVYAYGMTVLTTLLRLVGPYPEADSYQEIRDTSQTVGGEAGNAAGLLAGFGLKVKLDGPDLGIETKDPITHWFQGYGVDVSGLRFDESFPGWRDLVLVDDKTRTVFGTFGRYFSQSPFRWAPPNEGAIRGAGAVVLDPYFKEATLQVVKVCVEAKVPYVTLDCAPDSPEHRGSAANVVSREYRNREFPTESVEALMARYLAVSRGLVVFTSGPGEILFGRRGVVLHRQKTYPVHVVSTLGAGDVFRAAVAYGVLKAWEDEKIVSFAAATAAAFCAKEPGTGKYPGMEEVAKIQNSSR